MYHVGPKGAVTASGDTRKLGCPDPVTEAVESQRQTCVRTLTAHLHREGSLTPPVGAEHLVLILGRMLTALRGNSRPSADGQAWAAENQAATPPAWAVMLTRLQSREML